MTRDEQGDLADLGFHWGEAYSISVSDGVWRAHAFDRPADVLTADTADELRLLIRQDYRGRPRERRPYCGSTEIGAPAPFSSASRECHACGEQWEPGE
jgi:hypothetical protein